ncbi:MAG: glycoside hydrolase family 15 protein [Bacillota bacterium]
MKPYLVDAILGNGRALATLTRDAEIQRLFWPHIDGGQQVQRLLGGLSVNGGPVIWQDSDLWATEQGYEPDQNILLTTARLESGLTVQYRDTVTPGRDLLVRQLTFTNRGQGAAHLLYLLYQWIRIDENPLYNTAMYDEPADALVGFRRDLFVAVGGDRPLTGFTTGPAGHVFEMADRLEFPGREITNGDVAASGLWDLGRLQPGESVTLTLFWAMGRSPAEVRGLLAAARAEGAERLLEATRAYWTDFLAQARPLRVGAREPQPPALPGLPGPASPAEIESLYRRSLLAFKLMSDEQTGAVIAAPEFDPGVTQCGGYAYVWGRDAAYITVAMDLAGYHGMAGAFYRWALRSQEPEGWWMHRHYASGHWGPSWGLLQVDETGSILYGMGLHARLHGGREFAREVWPSVQRAAGWLIGQIDPETGLPGLSWDLWEERVAELTYSSGAVFGGLQAAADLAEMVGQPEQAARYRAAAAELKQAILRETVREGFFLRGRLLEVPAWRYEQAREAGLPVRTRTGAKGRTIYLLEEDPVPDTSLLGMSTPFQVVEPDNPVMLRTVQRLVERVWSRPNGGMLRYQGDHYRGGLNPWILCTLWLGLYEAERGNRTAAEQILDWAVSRRTRTGLLAEQVDPVTGEAVWVVPLTWSHAMYVLLALRLYGE